MKLKSNLKVLIIIFFASGFSSLIYQVAWQRILTLYYSVEHISTTLIVSVYMLGLGLGAILGGYLADKIKNKIRFYLIIELLIGLFGFLSIPFLEFLGKNTAGSNLLASFFYMFAFLSVPTFLMGITLPLLTKIFNNSLNNFLKSLSYLYFINTFGAAIGTLVSSYLLISFFGLDTSIYFAAAINIIIAIMLFIVKNRLPLPVEKTTYEQKSNIQNTVSFSNYKVIYVIVFLTGFIAIGYEIIWFRIIGTLVKASPYAFSSVLFVYLIGIAVGSYFMKKIMSKNSINKKNLFFAFQVLIALYVIISISIYYNLVAHVDIFSKINAASFSNILHPTLKNPSLSSPGMFLIDCFLIVDVFTWPLIFIFIPTLLMGASFPLITSLAHRDDKEGDTVGKVYFYNVLGNVTGGLITGLLLLGSIGTEYSLIVLSFIGFLFLLFIKSSRWFFHIITKIVFASLIIFLVTAFFPKKNQLYAVIHSNPKNIDKKKIITEGLDGVIVTYSYNDTLKTYINGMGHGGRPKAGFYYEAIKAISHQERIKNVLVIGFGTGTTIEALLKLNPRPKITLVELSETLIKNLRQVDYLNTFLNDDSLNLIFSDGRKYLYNNQHKYDAIFMDPLRSSTSYSNNLYSKQFFDLIKERLTLSGVFMIWIDEFHVIPKTVSSVFPFVTQYNYFCLASKKDLIENPAYKDDLFNLFPKYKSELLKIDSAQGIPLAKEIIQFNNFEYPINEDYKPWCEYFIGLNSKKYFRSY